jgi:hypothetical protein
MSELNKTEESSLTILAPAVQELITDYDLQIEKQELAGFSDKDRSDSSLMTDIFIYDGLHAGKGTDEIVDEFTTQDQLDQINLYAERVKGEKVEIDWDKEANNSQEEFLNLLKEYSIKDQVIDQLRNINIKIVDYSGVSQAIGTHEVQIDKMQLIRKARDIDGDLDLSQKVMILLKNVVAHELSHHMEDLLYDLDVERFCKIKRGIQSYNEEKFAEFWGLELVKKMLGNDASILANNFHKKEMKYKDIFRKRSNDLKIVYAQVADKLRGTKYQNLIGFIQARSMVNPEPYAYPYSNNIMEKIISDYNKE